MNKIITIISMMIIAIVVVFIGCVEPDTVSPSQIGTPSSQVGTPSSTQTSTPIPTQPEKPQESRFGIGIHTQRTDLNEEILELGDIYVRLNLWDIFGWRPVKGTTASRSVCVDCCNSSLSRTCSCEENSFYFCTPDSRDGKVVGEDLSDTFYAYNRDILFSVGPGDYGENEIIDPNDLVAEEYPANEQMYREYIEYLVEQYPDVEYWEVGNEANYPKFWDDTIVNYTRLVALSSNEIKSNCPECKVGISLASTAPTDKWFNAIIGVCDDIDFLDLHHYQSKTMDELTAFEENALTSWKVSCPGVEIISTETGLPSESITFKDSTWELGTSEEAQAQDIIKYYTMMFNAGYSKIYNYLVDHDFVAGRPDIFESIGVLTQDGRKKISFETYKLMIRKLDHFTSITKLSDGQYKYTFANKDPVYVLWCDSGSCSLPSEIQGTVKVTDYSGNEETKQASQIVLSKSPIFIE